MKTKIISLLAALMFTASFTSVSFAQLTTKDDPNPLAKWSCENFGILCSEPGASTR